MHLQKQIFFIENEIMALKLLKKFCMERLSKYPETYEEDLELLKKPTLTFNERNCILFRSSEKKVLLLNN